MGHGAIILEGVVPNSLSNMAFGQRAAGAEGVRHGAPWSSDTGGGCRKHVLDMFKEQCAGQDGRG